MKVLFIKNCPGQGKIGEVKDVNPGFAQNFLIKKGFAKPATEGLVKKMTKEAEEQRAKIERELNKIQKIIKEAEAKHFSLPIKVGSKGQIFGSIDGGTLIGLVNKKLGTNYKKGDLEIPHGLHKLGQYKVKLKLGKGYIAELTVEVVSHTSAQ